MSDQSFIESWSLDVDDIVFVDGFNLVSRVWVAFQLRLFRTHGRFPSREDDACPESLRYLGRQLDLVTPDPGRFRFHYVNTRRHRAAIPRHLDVRRASQLDRSALRAWLVEECRRSCATVAQQVLVSSSNPPLSEHGCGDATLLAYGPKTSNTTGRENAETTEEDETESEIGW